MWVGALEVKQMFELLVHGGQYADGETVRANRLRRRGTNTIRRDVE